ncbi:MAG TPA: FecR domain-containing protein [Bauldia sp.]
MKSTAYRLALVAVAGVLCALPRIGFADTVDTGTIGTAASIATVVTGTLSTQIQPLKSGDPVFQNETLTSDTSGVGQFEFRDGSKLALGPGSTLVLDNFVYSSDTSKSKIVINLSRGALRFITGNANHDAYQINTPTATIAVRGTAFDVYSSDDGELAVAMINGAIEVCPHGGICRVHDVIGKFLTMTSGGLFSLRDKWDGSFLRGISFKTALPFLGDQRPLVPALRGSEKIIGSYATATGKEVGKVLQLPGKVHLFRLPKLFR